MLGYQRASAERIVARFREYDERQVTEAAPHRKNLEKLIELSEQGRRDIASLMAEDVRLAPQVDKNDARRNQDGGEGEIAAQRLS